jgi:hypothetical protein
LPTSGCEPRLDDLISDPIMQLVLAADRVEERELRALVQRIRWRIAATRSPEPPAADAAEADPAYR